MAIPCVDLVLCLQLLFDMYAQICFSHTSRKSWFTVGSQEMSKKTLYVDGALPYQSSLDDSQEGFFHIITSISLDIYHRNPEHMHQNNPFWIGTKKKVTFLTRVAGSLTMALEPLRVPPRCVKMRVLR